ncbi:MAG: type II toxin-antitoxin system VapB family antitoxin [Burkholderiales bacterium]|nr:type II toxin-antitoxin system VapB family antitoxin [Burkholderiales bacterium]
MRTTINLDDELLASAKKVAAETGRTLTDVFEDALRESLARRRQARERSRITLPTFRGRGLQPGVDLDDAVALLDLMEGR